MKRYLPILSWLPEYKKDYLKGDLFAGITVGIILIPQGMAYALLAGLPPIYGLYAALFPQMVYAIFGTSRQLSVGPVALDSLLVATALGSLELHSEAEMISMAIFLSFMMGTIQVLMGFLRMGFLVNFLSKPVISGFTSAAAIIIGLSQIKHLLGIELEQSFRLHELVINLIPRIEGTNIYTLSIGIIAIGIIWGIKKWKKTIPGVLIVMVIAIAISYFLDLTQFGVNLLGDIPKGLPHFELPGASKDQILGISSWAIVLVLVGFMEAISIGKAIENKHDYYSVRPSQELIALGASNIVGSLFSSYPVTGGFSRSAVNNEAGAKTGISAFVAALIVALTLLFLTPLFYHLPKPILAAVIMVSVISLIDLKYPKRLWKDRKDEFILLLVTFGVTLFFGIIEGIVVGILFSLLLLVYRTAKPHVAELERIRGTDYFRNIQRFYGETESRPDQLILRFDSQLYFGNTAYFKAELQKRCAKKGDKLKAVILNAEAISYIDSTGANVLTKVIKEFRSKGIRFMICGAIGPARDIMFTSGIINELGVENLFVNTHEAVDYLDHGNSSTEVQQKITQQRKDK